MCPVVRWNKDARPHFHSWLLLINYNNQFPKLSQFCSRSCFCQLFSSSWNFSVPKNSKTGSTEGKSPLEYNRGVGPFNENGSLTLNIQPLHCSINLKLSAVKDIDLELIRCHIPFGELISPLGAWSGSLPERSGFCFILCYCIDWENIKVEESLELLKHEPSFHRWRNQDEDKVTGQRPPSLSSDHSAPHSWSHWETHYITEFPLNTNNSPFPPEDYAPQCLLPEAQNFCRLFILSAPGNNLTGQKAFLLS